MKSFLWIKSHFSATSYLTGLVSFAAGVAGADGDLWVFFALLGLGVMLFGAVKGMSLGVRDQEK